MTLFKFAVIKGNILIRSPKNDYTSTTYSNALKTLILIMSISSTMYVSQFRPYYKHASHLFGAYRFVLPVYQKIDIIAVY